MYAVLDIEATGGKRGEEDIIEIAIYKFDGETVVDQMISLVSPDRKIDPYVQKLTQITDKMVRTAPKFHELAKRIIEITEGTILVGHNIDFDYRMLRQEFKKLGYTYYRETIDTVPLSEKYFPDATSYSLGRLSKELGIPVSDRHRAAGDARATIELFKLLLAKDSEKNISKFIVEPKITSKKYFSYYKDLPNRIGLYYFLNEENEVIYLSRVINIAQGVRKLLTSKTGLANKIRLNFKSVKYEVTGSELISRLKEINEIRQLKPKFNAKTLNYRNALYLGEENGYKTLRIKPHEKTTEEPIMRFENLRVAKNVLSLIIEEFDLCPKLNEQSPDDKVCLSFEVNECFGACEGIESTESYNERVDKLLDRINIEDRNFLMIQPGRNRLEKAFVWVNKGRCEGYGYFDFHHQINSQKRIKERMIKLESDIVIESIIKGFLFSEKYIELISLD